MNLTSIMADKLLTQVVSPDYEYDVAVVGGGTAGIFAGICAAKSGAKTVIIERSSMLGGTSTNGGVNFPGLFHAFGKQIIAGPCWEAILRCQKLGGAVIPEIQYNPPEHWKMQVPTDIVIFNRVAEEMCAEAGASVMYYSQVFSAAEINNEDRKGVMLGVAGNDGCISVFAKKVIDSTGDANLSGILGYDRVRSEILQPATLRNVLSGYDIEKVDEDLANRMAEEAFENGTLNRDDFWGYKIYSNLCAHTFNTHIFSDEFSDSMSKTEVELRSRKILFKFIDFFKTIPGLENIKVSYLADECGVRETYRIVGQTTLTLDNYVTGYVYPDAVAYGYYPVDLHIRGGIDNKFVKEGCFPTISYGSLIPTKSGLSSENVLVAGRCIGADSYTMSALRVEAPCMAEGQVVGVAAALCAKSDLPVANVPFGALVSGLKSLGAIVPPDVSL